MAGLPAGVPALLAGQDVTFATAALDVADSYTGYGLGAPQWGLYLNGSPVVTADTVTIFTYQQDWAVADYPVEGGGFESYDKVNVPYKIVMQFVAGGSEANREALLTSIEAIADTLTLLDALTPEAVYIGVNVDHYSYRRTSNNGLGLLIVDVGLIEIREEGVTDFQNTINAASYLASPTSNIQSPAASTSALPSGVT